MISLDEISARLDGVKSMAGGGFVAKCPAHNDKNPSLRVSKGNDGRILMHCHTGCSTEDVAAALGIKMADLMPERTAPIQKAKPRVVATYDYEDANGVAVYSVLRLEPKGFRQAKIENGKRVYNMNGVERLPYHLPEVMRAAREGRDIVIVEGEKDVETLRALGITATCNSGGAGKWDADWNPWFVGARRVYIVADNDGADKKYPGQRHAWSIHKGLDALQVPNTLTFVETGKDASDYVDATHADGAAFMRMLDRGEAWPKEWNFDEADEVQDELAPAATFNIQSLADFPPYQDEALNKDILIKGRWLERGGSAFWISTAGTGKSIVSIQLALLWSAGLPFAGLAPNGMRLKIWIIQSEDSPSRITIDREDIIAELTEQNNLIDWREIAKTVKFVNLGPKVGADFLDALDAALAKTSQEDGDAMPDVIILNPFLAFVGGPITDGSFVTPFLRGGIIGRKETIGLQLILERYNIATLIFHHTPKPPSDKELDAWMKSAFPEYQGAGSADLTNWGRSFITMMKVKGRDRLVMLTAGKNGSELGWRNVDGANRCWMAWSKGTGITGRARHAWRALDDEEMAEIIKDGDSELNRAIETIITAIKEEPMTPKDIRETFEGKEIKKGVFRAAWRDISSAPVKHGIFVAEAKIGKTRTWYYGLKDEAERCAREAEWRAING